MSRECWVVEWATPKLGKARSREFDSRSQAEAFLETLPRDAAGRLWKWTRRRSD